MTHAWFRTHLLDELLPRWLAAVDTRSGLFQVHLDREWRRSANGPITLVSQSRSLYNFATAYRLTAMELWRDAVEKGAAALIRMFADRDHGGWLWSLSGDGSPLDARKSAYGHAFGVFGLSLAFAATGIDAFRDAACETAELMRTRFTDRHGGIIPMLTADWQDTGATRTQNPIMHLFEALTSLGVEAHAAQGGRLAQTVADWVLDRLVRGTDGVVPGLFNDEWQELPEEGGGRIDIGHQFEWAYLLSRAVELGVLPPPKAPGALHAATRMLDAGMRMGYDAERGGVRSPAAPDGRLLATGKGWWEQCEAARAMLHFAHVRGRSDLLASVEATMRLCRRSFIDPVHGGWFMRVEADGSVPNTAKGNEWKVDYHVVGLCAEAIRLL